jgi:terminase large subunit-like protein
MTFTPIKGVSNVVKRYVLESSPSRAVIKMTLNDALHYSDEARAELIAQYPDHEIDARTKGIPAMGSGRVFLVDEERLLVEPFTCPDHWVRLGGIDIGWDHPSAFCELWWDRDLDVVYLARTLRVKYQTVHQLVDHVRDWNLIWAWPQDGLQSTLAGAGEPVMEQFRAAGLDMMHERAQFEGGGNSVEAGLMEMHDRMRGDRWKVFKGQNDAWLEEYRMLHRKDGLLVKEGDDAIAASRYGLMMLRHGRTANARRDFFRQIRYSNAGIV